MAQPQSSPFHQQISRIPPPRQQTNNRGIGDIGQLLQPAPPGFRLPTADSTSKLASTLSVASTGALYKEVFEHISHQLNDLLRLPDNWDDEGSSRFTGVHVTRVKEWLADLFRTYSTRHGRSPSHPRIAEASGPSIDVYWKSEEFTLLINFPSDANELCTFYGFNPEGKEEFQGKVGVGALADRISCLIGELILDVPG